MKVTYTEEKKTVPSCTWHTRIRDSKIGGDNPYRWQDVTSDEIFADKRVIVFSLPGAFTPTCSTYQLPDFEEMYDQFKEKGIDAIYCISVNDSFVMNKWSKDQGLKHVKVIPDGSGEFTRDMGMLVTKDNLGFGVRSWRYAMVVNDGVVEKMFVEPGKENNCEDDPYGKSSPQNIIKEL